MHGVKHLTEFLDKTLEALELLILTMVISLLRERLGQMITVFIREKKTLGHLVGQLFPPVYRYSVSVLC